MNKQVESMYAQRSCKVMQCRMSLSQPMLKFCSFSLKGPFWQ